MLNIAHQQLGHLVVIVDHNGGATIGHLDKIDGVNDGPRLDSIVDKFKSFGFLAFPTDGHDIKAMWGRFKVWIERKCPQYAAPVALVCDTVKGKGIKSMEDGSFFPTHYRLPMGADLEKALKNLGMDAVEFKTEVGGENVGY